MSTKTSITVDLPSDLFDSLCRISIRTGKNVDCLIEAALSKYLLGKRSPGQAKSDLPTFDLGGVKPGVDLDNSAALLDMMNADEYVEGYRGPYH